MIDKRKNELLSQAKEHIIKIQEKIMDSVRIKEIKNSTMSKESIRMHPGDALAARKILAINQERVENLKQLYPSPYFNLCEFVVNGEKKSLYFSKFSFIDENIYSWVTPAAALRFEKPGVALYSRPDGSKSEGQLMRKDQYMIVDGKLIFFSIEEAGKNRELIHQEHFTRHKQGFILPEVVEQMEKAQDQVVRASYRGPFLISGPAGSGKTTLALHRVAYLLQSPETVEYFSPDSILVMVQDSGTKEYFSHLLPDLGIKSVSIITFAEWASSILGLEDYEYTTGTFIDDAARLTYEHSKISAMRNSPQYSSKKNIFSKLEDMYTAMNKEQKNLFEVQKKEKKLDRFDLTILLQAYLNENKILSSMKEYYEQMVNGKYRKRKSSFPVQYNLAVIDEFQNYLPEQIRLFKTCMNHRVDSMVYVGDLAQQTRLGTIKDWQNIGEEFDQERMVVLQKVYRNTKQILNFIGDLGYKVSIPAEIKSGLQVNEVILVSKEEEIQYIKKHLTTSTNTTIGILCKEEKYLTEFKIEFSDFKNVFCLDFREAQGVEFDQVFIIGVNKNSFTLSDIPGEILEESKKIYKDLLYVALTRAMSELHVLGTTRLKESINHL